MFFAGWGKQIAKTLTNKGFEVDFKDYTTSHAIWPKLFSLCLTLFGQKSEIPILGKASVSVTFYKAYFLESLREYYSKTI
jgi:hypothetical protein